MEVARIFFKNFSRERGNSPQRDGGDLARFGYRLRLSRLLVPFARKTWTRWGVETFGSDRIFPAAFVGSGSSRNGHFVAQCVDTEGRLAIALRNGLRSMWRKEQDDGRFILLEAMIAVGLGCCTARFYQ